MDIITSEILERSLDLKKLIYAREQFTDDKKLHHALSKARAALIKLDKAINEPNSLQVEQHAGKFKINEILNTDILELFKKDIRFKQLITG